MSNLYPHNQEIYDGIIRAIADGYKKIGYTEATGLGKSFVFIELCKTVFKGKKILYVVPKVCISEAITFYKEYKFISDYVDFTTYAMFNSEDKVLEFAKKYDVLVADECHHLLSDIQGCNVDICGSLISGKLGGFYIGMSATVILGSINVLNKFFDTQIYGNDIYDAIIKGLYPKMDYIVALPDNTDIPKDLAVKYNVDCTKPMLEQVLSGKELHKILIFFSNIKELKENISYVRDLFYGYKIYSIYSESEEDFSNQEILNLYNECSENCVLLSVSMLLEGVHIEGVDCAIIYRNVTKLHTLLQIVGRLFYYGMGKSPLIVDITDSIRLLNKVEKSSQSQGGKVEGGRILRRVINPLCSGYKYIDFLNDYSLSAKRFSLVEDYRGLRKGVYTSKTLSTTLGVSIHVVNEFRKRNKDYSVEKVIDYVLDVYKKGGVKKSSRYCLSKPYRGVNPFSSLADLSNQLDVPLYILYEYVKGKDKTAEEVVDYILDESHNDNYTKYILTEEYRGVNPGRHLTNIASQLNVSVNVLRDYVKGKNVSVKDIIDYILDDYKCNIRSKTVNRYVLTEEYRGVKPCNSLVELSNQLGVKIHILRDYVKGKDIGIKGVIDYVLDDYMCNGKGKTGRKYVLTEEYRGVKPCNSIVELSSIINVSIHKLRDYLKGKDASIYDVIDYALDEVIPCQGSVDVK